MARATGLSERYALMLVQLGRATEAVRAGLEHFVTVAQAFSLARGLREIDNLDEALRLAEHGLSLDGPKAQLATWRCDLASGLGRLDVALAAAVMAVREDANVPSFQRVRELAGPHWPEYRDQLLAHLRKSTSYVPRGTVEVFLHEKLIDDAISAVGRDGYRDVVELVVRSAIEERPEWAIRTCQRQAESIMDRGKAQYYRDAARWLEHARKAYRVLGRLDDWRTYLTGLISQHARKYKLRPMLEALA